MKDTGQTAENKYLLHNYGLAQMLYMKVRLYTIIIDVTVYFASYAALFYTVLCLNA